MNTEDKKKFKHLQPGYYKRCRRDYIETDYVNGVYDDNGNQVIRPLNEEEKQWLNDYYKRELDNVFDREKIGKRLKKRLDKDNNTRKNCVLNLNNSMVTIKKKDRTIKLPIKVFEKHDTICDEYLKRSPEFYNHEDILIEKVEQSIKAKEEVLEKRKNIRKSSERQ